MKKVKIGFIPAHRIPFGDKWAVEMRARCLKVMKKIPGAEIVVPDDKLTFKGVVCNLEDAKKTLALFQEQGVSGVIVGGMTFGQEVSAVGVIIAGMPKGTPVLHFATKGQVNPDGTRPSDSWCGQFMIASAMKRREIQFEHIPTCFPEEPVFEAAVSRFVRACAATKVFRGARIGQIGVRPWEFESVWFDEAVLQRDFNQTVVPIDLADMFMRLDEVSANEAEVKKVIRQITAGAETPAEATDFVTVLARMEVAMLRLAREHNLDALAVNCWEQVQKRYGICVCSTLGRLTDQGLLCACEVDVYGASTMLAAFGANLGQTPPHFIDWTELHPTKQNVWLAWHCGNAPPSSCASDCHACIMEHSIMPRRPAWGTREFRLKTGAVTCCRLVEYDGFFTMFIGSGEVVNMKPDVRGSYGWVKVKDVVDWERKMIDHGIIHHGVLIHDPEVADALESFCKFNRIDVVRGA